jgi:hypothetical protein
MSFKTDMYRVFIARGVQGMLEDTEIKHVGSRIDC